MIYVGMGGNLGDVRATFRAAAARLGARRVSSLWETAPVGPVADQPWFLNAVAELDEAAWASPRALLERLMAVEAELGRDRAREQRMGPRTLDLDLLVFGRWLVDEPDLVVPHPRLHERAFALAPLVELAGEDFEIPGGRGRAGDLLARARPGQPIRRVEK